MVLQSRKPHFQKSQKTQYEYSIPQNPHVPFALHLHLLFQQRLPWIQVSFCLQSLNPCGKLTNRHSDLINLPVINFPAWLKAPKFDSICENLIKPVPGLSTWALESRPMLTPGEHRDPRTPAPGERGESGLLAKHAGTAVREAGFSKATSYL